MKVSFILFASSQKKNTSRADQQKHNSNCFQANRKTQLRGDNMEGIVGQSIQSPWVEGVKGSDLNVVGLSQGPKCRWIPAYNAKIYIYIFIFAR